MPLIALEPPQTRPRGQGIGTSPLLACGLNWCIQFQRGLAIRRMIPAGVRT